MIRLLTGDARELLKTLPDESVNCCVTSPPYWGLRDYGVEGQLGLEKTPELYVAEMVGIFREVRRVLRSDGTLWLNLGDSYAGSGKGREADGFSNHSGKQATNVGSGLGKVYKVPKLEDIKPKDLCGIPWLVAFALRADGWYLRQDIIWSKPNPMPESVRDRCTKAHEYIFMLSKSSRYYYDADSIKELCVTSPDDTAHHAFGTPGGKVDQTPGKTRKESGKKWERGEPKSWNGSSFTDERDLAVRPTTGTNRKQYTPDQAGGGSGVSGHSGAYRADGTPLYGEYRNKRSVWEITTRPYSEAHFATFPPDLIEPCIKAGCPVGGTVLDPFSGAGTTGLVSARFQCNYIGIELNEKYVEMSKNRIEQDAPMFNEVQV